MSDVFALNFTDHLWCCHPQAFTVSQDLEYYDKSTQESTIIGSFKIDNYIAILTPTNFLKYTSIARNLLYQDTTLYIRIPHVIIFCFSRGDGKIMWADLVLIADTNLWCCIECFHIELEG